MNLTLFDKLFRLKAIKWKKILEGLPLLKMVLNRVILVVTDGLNKELCVGAHLFAKEVIRLVRKSGFLFTALYLNVLCQDIAASLCRNSPENRPLAFSRATR
ncbi:hypothetical protein Lal_00042209 [Lupinus albus]|nr:hypothetical protein Lal_00042209 [Lupinus albus]